MPIFRFPFFNSSNYYNNYYNLYNKHTYHTLDKKKIDSSLSCDLEVSKKNNSKVEGSTEPYFFELFGLKLFFDDILLICLIFFLYDEGVKDDELFVSLILLLLS